MCITKEILVRIFWLKQETDHWIIFPNLYLLILLLYILNLL